MDIDGFQATNLVIALRNADLKSPDSICSIMSFFITELQSSLLPPETLKNGHVGVSSFKPFYNSLKSKY